MAKTLGELLRERPGNPEVQAEHRQRMLAEVRAYRLRELREMLAMTQTEVAQTLAVSQKRVSEIERGQVDFTKVDTLRRYAAALGGTLKVEVQVGEESFQIA
jgi:transcriptional regulator with XRE-family HTH domain